MTIVREDGIWIARRDDDTGIFSKDLLELAQLLKRCGWI